jgi:hypothetical protein
MVDPHIFLLVILYVFSPFIFIDITEEFITGSNSLPHETDIYMKWGVRSAGTVHGLLIPMDRRVGSREFQFKFGLTVLIKADFFGILL